MIPPIVDQHRSLPPIVIDSILRDFTTCNEHPVETQVILAYSNQDFYTIRYNLDNSGHCDLTGLYTILMHNDLREGKFRLPLQFVKAVVKTEQDGSEDDEATDDSDDEDNYSDMAEDTDANDEGADEELEDDDKDVAQRECHTKSQHN
ncbi:hypothetical protein ACH5RR_039681 [Cinchona calisaya]|uniref:Uncharacterized protein n=1 Tax=Cinchona calisaya TaxID=153742 RepID=A0ABD2Y0A1_9GENT